MEKDDEAALQWPGRGSWVFGVMTEKEGKLKREGLSNTHEGEEIVWKETEWEAGSCGWNSHLHLCSL